MVKAIIQKEWIKTRGAALGSAAVAVVVALYAVLRMSRLIELKGVDHLWLIMILKDNSFIDAVKWVPVAAGIAVAIAQMVPEMVQKRLKLTLHLPVPQSTMILIMLAVGVVELTIIYCVQLLILAVYDSSILPPELCGRVMLTALPWYLAGYMAYLLTAAITLESSWMRRTVMALGAVMMLVVCFEQPAMEAYNGMILLMIVVVICITALALGSVIRFKEGR